MIFGKGNPVCPLSSTSTRIISTIAGIALEVALAYSELAFWDKLFDSFWS